MNFVRLSISILLIWIVGLNRLGASQPQEENGLPVTADDQAALPVAVNAEVVQLMDFEQEHWDRNYDDWPDDWKRRTGSGFPAYIEMGIVDSPDNGDMWGKKCLRVKLDGGAAEISSPPIPINPNYSYVLDGWVKTLETRRGEQNEAWFSLTLASADGSIRQKYATDRVRHQADWAHLQLGPVVPTDARLDHLILTVHLHPTRPTDLFGEAWFDNIRLTHLPKLNATTSHPFNLFEKPEDVSVSVSVSGVQASDAKLTFQLFDVEGDEIDCREVELNSKEQVRAGVEPPTSMKTIGFLEDSPSVPVRETEIEPGLKRQRGKDDRIIWSPTIPSAGYYRVLVSLSGDGQPDLMRDISLVVMPSIQRINTSPFGWNIQRQSESIALQNLVELLRQAGVHWVAYPVWFAKEDEAQAQRIGELAERLTLNGMELVAVLDEPPPELQSEFTRFDRGIAAVLHDADLWQPAIDPVMNRLSFKVTWWQLGGLTDMSFVNHPNVDLKVGEIRDHLSRFGKNIKLGITWNWLYGKRAEDSGSLDYLLKTSMTKMTGQELQRYLQEDQTSSTPIWTTLQPLDRINYDLKSRARDLIERMIIAKINGATTVFVPEPISTYHGILNDDLSPGELLVPWRLTSQSLAGAEYLGRLELSNGSENYIFRRSDDVVMVIWNDHDTTEAMQLGPDLTVQDSWGRNLQNWSESSLATLQVGPSPQFVSGIDPDLVEWQMNCKFSETHIDSVVGRAQFTSLEFQNSLDFGVSGKATLTSNQLWEKPLVIPFKVNPGETFSAPIELILRSNVSAADHEVRIDFDIAGHRRHTMTVFRHLDIGIEGIRVDSATQIKNGQLLVHATVINDTPFEANFSLYLFAPNRRRQRLQIGKMLPGRARRTFIVNDGESLQGKDVWLRVEEVRGNQILNYQIHVDEPEVETP